MNCCICKKVIEALPESEGELNPDYVEPPGLDELVNKTNWNGGTVDFIIPGYGSNHDLTKFRIAMCDDCLTRETEAGVIDNLGEIQIGMPYREWFEQRRLEKRRVAKILDFQNRLKAYEGREELWYPDDLYYLMKDALEYIEQRG